MLSFQFGGFFCWPSNLSRALHPLPLRFLSDCVDMYPSPSRLHTSAISSCTKALCDVQWDACILIVQEQDVSQAGQHGVDMEKTSGSTTQLPSTTLKLWLRVIVMKQGQLYFKYTGYIFIIKRWCEQTLGHLIICSWYSLNYGSC